MTSLELRVAPLTFARVGYDLMLERAAAVVL